MPKETRRRQDDEPLHLLDRAAWDAWLGEHGERVDGAWLAIAKKGSGATSVTHAEALEVALAHGWIDAVRHALDDTHFLQRFTPRRPRSKWSQINRAKALELIERGEMRPAGLREVERAKADGRWDAAYEPQSRAQVPDDLQRALDADPKVAAEFAGLDSQNRYAILFRLRDAKRPETRARRLETFVDMLRRGDRLHP